MLDSIKYSIAEMISKILEVQPDGLDERVHFGEYGFESVSMTELAGTINRTFGTDINASDLYEHNTIHDLSVAINRLTDEKGDAREAVQTESSPGDDDALHSTESIVASIVGGIAGVPEPELGKEDRFGELGFESVSMGELADRISGRFEIDLTPASLYEHNTIRRVSSYIRSLVIPREDGDAQACSSTLAKAKETSMKAKVTARGGSKVSPDTDIAVIGMSGIFPGSSDIGELWTHITNGDSLLSPIPGDRKALREWYDNAKANNPGFPEIRAGFMNRIDEFDPIFFGISPREAASMDPQQRLLLEVAWHALEDAGHTKSAIAGSDTGVFIGISSSDFADVSQAACEAAFFATGKAYSIAANRISYFLDIHGPSQPVDTACSSSLVAVHYAIQAILRGECGMAIAGGVNVILSPAYFRSFMDAGMLSPECRCKTFDKNADGYARGEGAALVILKPLAAAEKDRDRIHAVIKSSAVNHGGRAHSLTAPNADAQAELIVRAYGQAGIDPSSIGYIEAHGTGTRLGDPIEVNALKKAFRTLGEKNGAYENEKKTCGLGSVKTNIGHLEAAAGIAGMIKAILSMRFKTIPRTINFNELNPYIRLDDSPFYVADETGPWIDRKDASGNRIPRRAGVSSFGFGGANAHVVLEEYEQAEAGSRDEEKNAPRIIPLSAKNEESLKEYARLLVEFIGRSAGPESPESVPEVTTDIGGRLVSIVSSIIDVDEKEIGLNEELSDMGLDRVQAERIARAASAEFDVDPPWGELPDNATICTLAESILRKSTVCAIERRPEADGHTHTGPGERIELDDVAYTFQSGREAMDERLALVVRSVAELGENLSLWLKGEKPACPFASGNTNDKRTNLDDVFDGDELTRHASSLALAGRIDRIARLWARGARVDWRSIPGNDRGRLASLPAYPFSRESIPIGPGGQGEELQTDRPNCERTICDAGAGPVDRIRDALRNLVARLAGIGPDDIDPKKEFDSYGVTSILLAELAEKINASFSIDILPVVFFDHSTLDDLAGYLASAYGETISRNIGFDFKAGTADTERVHTGMLRANPEKSSIGAREQDKGGESPHRASYAEKIAIIGMSMKFPMAENADRFWENLVQGRNCITEIPPDRWDWREHYGDPSVEPGKTNVKWGGFMDGIGEFDPFFFGISPKEAELMDPQQRLLMMHVWKCIEDAGYDPRSLAGSRTSVFIGTAQCGYTNLITSLNLPVENYTALGTVASLGPNRMSYMLDLRGPSEPVETACSSSLVAIHRAMATLRDGSCELALAGGVHTMVTPDFHISISKSGMLAPDGLCKTFSDKADGYARGEGVAVLMLKPLSAAERDGDNIYGVILSSSVNHGGRANSLTAPRAESQASLIEEAHTKAGIDPRSVTYIEAHGTGTKLGDPIEIEGLKLAFDRLYAKAGVRGDVPAHCGLGSVKTNIGHLELAAGVAGVIKVLLQLKHRTLVKSLHSDSINPLIRLSGSPFYIVRENSEWKSRTDEDGNEMPRRAGVSSFGFGGVNSHVVIEEYVQKDAAESGRDTGREHVLVLSAKNGERLAEQARALAAALERDDFAYGLADTAYTLLAGREAMDERLAIVVSAKREAVEALEAFASGRAAACPLFSGNVKKRKGSDASVPVSSRARGYAEEPASDLERMASGWCAGEGTGLLSLYEGRRMRRVPLPTYQFARDRYWVSGGAENPGARKSGERETEKHEDRNTNTIKEEASDFEIKTFEEYLEEEPILSEPLLKSRAIVSFAPNARSGRIAREAIEGREPGIRHIIVTAGKSFRKVNGASYTVSVTEPSSIARALSAIRDENGEIDGLFYLFPLFESAYAADYSLIVRIIRAVHESGITVKRVYLCTRSDDSSERCYAESWIGFERSLSMALPGTGMHVVYFDEPRASGEESIRERIRMLLAESGAVNARSVFITEGKRFTYKTRETWLEHPRGTVKTRGTYIVTGGCGGLGTIFAEYLSSQFKANILLTGRSDTDGRISAKLKRIELLGGKCAYARADSTDARAMRKAVAMAKKLFGTVDGVIHAAGMVDERSVLEKDEESFSELTAAKISGTIALERALEGEDVDFVCYFSSASAMLGDFGHCDYSVANRFLMAYADHAARTLKGRRTVAICWPLWRDGGMRLGDESASDMYLKASGFRLLESAEGVRLFESILSGNARHCLVLPIRRNRVSGFLESMNKRQSVEPPERSTRPGERRRDSPEGSTVAECVESDLRDITGSMLKIDRERLDRNAILADFGFDSISLASFAAALSAHYGFKVSPSVFFGYSTLEKLTGYFTKEHAAEMNAFYAEGTTVRTTDTDDESVKRVEDGAARTHLFSAFRSTERSRPGPANEPIAIIGMSGRFPGARSVDEMWAILEKGIDAVGEFPEERLPRNERGGKKRKCGVVPGVKEFDPLFFEISPLEAENMDPRQRLLLQEAWNALEDAGYGKRFTDGKRIGMFVGVEAGNYEKLAGYKGNITNNHDGVLAARLAYFMNLKGPVMAINTACSSGLAAVHAAVSSLLTDECDAAIASSANLFLNGETLRAMEDAGMVSPDYVCRAFDKRANGLVPGEAVVAVVLKRLSRAIADKDPVHAVIKGIGVNYDGKTNGITAPNGVAQAELIKSVYEKIGMNPERIGYVLAHGTGTRLGDPVEVNALCDAFRAFTRKNAYCALGSAKPNFGHTLAPSGLVSLVSMTMAIKNRTIPASLNCEEESDYVNWPDTPFYVNVKTRKWETPDGAPRTGTVSAFGMSGTNVHCVIEEYTERGGLRAASPAKPLLLVLSAKSEEALDGRIALMKAAMESATPGTIDTADICYTLMEGRHHLDHRFAAIPDGIDDLLSILGRALSKEAHPRIFRGKAAQDRQKKDDRMIEASAVLAERGGNAAVPENEYAALAVMANAFCSGYDISWSDVSSDDSVKRIRLPSYPFARDVYWSEDGLAESRIDTGNASRASIIHPLLHENTSDFSVQRYSSFFTGREFFLRDHVVMGVKVFPGVAYLEMAFAAALHATGSPADRGYSIKIESLAWMRALRFAKGPERVDIELKPESDGSIEFDILHRTDEPDGRVEVLSRGSVTISSPAAPDTIDVGSIEARCGRRSMEASECYERLKGCGLDYGPDFMGLERIFIGKDEVLARIVLPGSQADAPGSYTVHPSLLDSAFQSAIGLLAGRGEKRTYLPFALDSIEITGAFDRSMWAHVRRAGNARDEAEVMRLDADIASDTGEVRARVRGFLARLAGGDDAPVARDSATERPNDIRSTDKEDRMHAGSDDPGDSFYEHLFDTIASGELSREDAESVLDMTSGGRNG